MTNSTPYTNRRSIPLAALLILFANAAWTAPGGVTDGLRVWLRADLGVQTDAAGNVSEWSDQSGSSNNATYNGLNPFGELPPRLNPSNPGIAGLPSIRFENQNALEIDLSWLAGSDYTIFVVNGRDRFGLANFYIAGDSLLTDSNLVLGYEQEGLLRLAHFINDLDAQVNPYMGQPVWAMDTFRFDQDNGRDIFQDGKNVASDQSQTPLASNTGSTLGHFRAFGTAYWFRGDLAEVVIYDRALSPFERLRIEAELASTYGRPIEPKDYAPCEGDWRNRFHYIRTLIRTILVFRQAGLLARNEALQVLFEGLNSTCGDN